MPDPAEASRATIRVRVFIDYWNFQLSMNAKEVAERSTTDYRFKVDWKGLGPWLARKARETVGADAISFDGVIIYTSYAGLVLATLALWPSVAWAGGWSLIVPPRTAYDERAEFLKGSRILSDTPFARWTQYSAYDSAGECEEARNLLTAGEQDAYSAASDRYLRAVSKGLLALTRGGRRRRR